MKKLFSGLVLPSEITDFERSYLRRLDRVALAFFAAHVPVFVAVAWLNHTRPLLALALTCAVLAGPVIAVRTFEDPRHVSLVHGVAAMFFGGLLVHFGQGPMQIEMHFYFFALVAMCAVFGNPMVIVVAAVTVALHHLVVWMVLPRSVFNYSAGWWVVAVHALFVVIESVAMCFIARSFFDNVIGLERIVLARTTALDGKNRDLRLLLDNAQQGFLTVDREGRLVQERSAAVDRWFGRPEAGASWFDHLGAKAPGFAYASRVAWAQVSDGILPLEVTLDQMPKRLSVGATQYRVEYRPIGQGDPAELYLVIVTDVTTEIEAEAAETERRETLALFERALADRSGLEMFLEEAGGIVDDLVQGASKDPAVVKRLLHTLKGNAAMFGLGSVAHACHRLEDSVADEGRLPSRGDYAPLAERWTRLAGDIGALLGHRSRTIEVDDRQLAELSSAVRSGASRAALLKRLDRLRLEPTRRRLEHFAEQARRIGSRIRRADVEVRVDDGGVRLDAQRWRPFWSSFIHAVRNAVDHGIESPSERRAAGKPEKGTVALRTREDASHIFVEISDDGRGIDWAAVAERAKGKGLPAGTPEDLRRALFADGLSTAPSVTDVSGRGIGMGALLAGTRALGGELTVETVPGLGTKIRMTFPASAAAPVAGPARDAVVESSVTLARVRVSGVPPRPGEMLLF